MKLTVVVFFWVFLYGYGYPLPMTDDLYFIGAAMNMAAGHGYANPYSLRLEMVGSQDHFYAYVPLHSYVLAGWIKMFGLSFRSLAFFQCLAGAVASWGFGKLLEFRFRGYFLSLMVCSSVAVYLGVFGLRPDALALAFLGLGTCILRCQSLVRWALCAFSLFLSLITAPTYAPIVFLVLAWAALAPPQKSDSPIDSSARRWSLLLVAGLAAFFLFLIMIDFQLRSFLGIFHAASGLSQADMWKGYYRRFTEAMHGGVRPLAEMFIFPAWMIWFLLAALLRPSAFDFRLSWTAMGGILLGLAGIFVTVFSSVTGLYFEDFYCMLVLLMLVLGLASAYRMAGRVVLVALFALYVFEAGPRTIQLACLPFYSPDLHQEKIEEQVQALNPARVYVDNYALAAVYDYKLPANTYDFCMGSPYRWTGPYSREDFPKDSVLILSKENLIYYKSLPMPSFPAIPLIGYRYPFFAANPYDFVVVKVP